MESVEPLKENEKPQDTATKKSSLDFIKELQTERGSKLITYIVSTRQGVNFVIADDAVRIIYDHLENLKIKKDDKVDLFLHSFGGAGLVPWKLVNLIREFSTNFEVLVPYKAYSAATLIALGANKIVMHPMAELGPVDPKVANEFNPVNPQGQPVGINVEDVASYISFIKDFVGIRHENELIQSLNTLTNNVHPLAIGNVHRFYSQSRMMARKLLKLHMTDPKDEHIIEEVAETLTSKLFFHGHPINRKEAANLKLKIDEPSEKIQNLMWNLYLSYEEELEMKTPFNPQEMLNNSGQSAINSVKVGGACVEGEARKDKFITEFKITRPPAMPGAPLPLQMQSSMGAIVIPLNSGWKTERSI
ncbi:MAG: hypothetical protein PHQ20_03570 [Candidatus Moranbacteria bacterium]|nr:hypothetical protein [Candidatus Moranbacteria bacterium]